MAQDPNDLKRAIHEMGQSAPIVWVGKKLAEGGAAIQRGYETVKRKVSGPPQKDPRIGRKLVNGRVVRKQTSGGKRMKK